MFLSEQKTACRLKLLGLGRTRNGNTGAAQRAKPGKSLTFQSDFLAANSMMKRDTTIVNTLLSEYHNIKNFQVPTLVFTDFQRLPRPQKGALKTGKTFKHSQGPGKASMYREEENRQ